MPDHQNDNDNEISLDRRLFCAGAASLLALGTAGCGDGGGGFGGLSASATGTTTSPAAASASASAEAVASATSAPAATEPTSTSTTQARKFTHPGLLHTDADFERMRTKVAAGAQPWLDGWNALTASSRAQLGRAPVPLATVVRGGDGENHRTMVEDMERAYQFALRWKVSGNTAYADLAVQYLDAWSSTMTALNGNADRFLAAGIYGYQWANAAEMMRSYTGWSAEGVARFQKLLLEVFYPLCHSFLLNHNGANITNYWANWISATSAASWPSASSAIAPTSTTRPSRTTRAAAATARRRTTSTCSIPAIWASGRKAAATRATPRSAWP